VPLFVQKVAGLIQLFRALLQKLIFTQLGRKFLSFYENQTFFIEFIKNHQRASSMPVEYTHIKVLYDTFYLIVATQMSLPMDTAERLFVHWSAASWASLCL
jgi:hypothetical protein